MRFFGRMSVVGSRQIVFRSSASVTNCSGLVGVFAGVSLMCFSIRLSSSATRSSAVPAKLQFRGHKPIGRVGRVVLAECFVGGIAGCFEVARERIAHQIAALAFLLIRLQRRFDRSWFEHAKKLVFNGVIDAKAAERDACRLAIVEPAASTGIAWDVVIAAGVMNGHLLTAAPAAHQPGKKCCAAFGGADLLRSRGIARYHFPDRFRTRPVDITLVGAGKQGQPFLARLAPDAAARSCFAVTRLARGLSVGVGATIDRIREDSVDCRIRWTLPDEIAFAHRVGNCNSCSRNYNNVWRALPSSANFVNTRPIASCTRRSGSFSRRSSVFT